MIAGSWRAVSLPPGFGPLLQRPEHASRLRGALLRVARLALVAIDCGVVISVYQLHIVRIAARHARGVHKPADGIDARVPSRISIDMHLRIALACLVLG
jgi:hypothetical protein